MNSKALKRTVSLFTTAAVTMTMLCSGISANAASGSSISYTFTGNNASDAGYAEGKITFTSDTSGTYDLYWADDEKILDGYYSIATFKMNAGESKSVKMGYHTAIPANATKIIAVKGTKTVASAKAVYSVPENKQLMSESGDLLYTFNSYSDVHIDNNGYYKKAQEHLAEAFKFGVDKNTDFIVSSGDMVTNAAGPDGEWKAYEKILKNSDYVNPVWESSGNHDTRCGLDGLNSFRRATGLDSTQATLDSNNPYYYVTEKNTGDVFIFMALESHSNPSNYEEFSEGQLEWVNAVVEDHYYSGVNVYLIEHSPIKGFGAGDRMSNPYYKALLDEKHWATREFKKILTKYPNLIFLSGHTHEDFAMGYNYSDSSADGKTKGCHMIHNPAVAGSTMPQDNDKDLEYNNGYGFNSQGYYVETYQNRIVFYGANLTDELIYPGYSYIMEGSRSDAAENTNDDDITLSGVTVPASEKISEVSDILSGYYKYASYDQYQALKKLYYKYRNDSTADKNVIAEFNKRIAALKMIAGETNITYPVGDKYYFENTKSWNKVYAYAWTGSSNNAAWPGVLLNPIGTSNGKNVYRIDFNSAGQYQNLIFNNGSNQTVDITLNQYPNNAFRLGSTDSNGKYKVNNFKFEDGTDSDTDSAADSDTDSNTDTETDTDNIIITVGDKYYFENTKSWKKVYAYAWTGSSHNAAWPGVQIYPVGTSNGKDVYRIDFNSAGQYQNLIFNNGSNQTVDIALDQYPNNAFRLGSTDSNGKYKVENFKFENGTDSDTDSNTDTDNVIVSDRYVLLYYIEGKHAWNTLDTWFTTKNNSTYEYSFTADGDCKISFSVYDKKKNVYESLPESLICTYENGKTFGSSVKSASSRGRSLTVNNMKKGDTLNIVYDHSAETLSAACKTLNK